MAILCLTAVVLFVPALYRLGLQLRSLLRRSPPPSSDDTVNGPGSVNDIGDGHDDDGGSKTVVAVPAPEASPTPVVSEHSRLLDSGPRLHAMI